MATITYLTTVEFDFGAVKLLEDFQRLIAQAWEGRR
jgi:hypothetical protein